MNDTTDPSMGYVPEGETTKEFTEKIRQSRCLEIMDSMVARVLYNFKGGSAELAEIKKRTEETLADFISKFVDIEMDNQAKTESEHLNPMTGVLNRKGAERIFDLLVREKDRKKGEGKIVVVRLDLDNFKKINDLGDHNLGDALLKAVANRLRETDIIIHFSGDEFGLLLPDVKPGEKDKQKISLDETIGQILARVVRDIEDEGEKIKKTDPRVKDVTITASVGYKVVPENREQNETFASFDTQADQAVNRSKKFKGTHLSAQERIIGADKGGGGASEKLTVTDAELGVSKFMGAIGRAVDGIKKEVAEEARAEIDKKIEEIKEIIKQNYKTT